MTFNTAGVFKDVFTSSTTVIAAYYLTPALFKIEKNVYREKQYCWGQNNETKQK